MENSYKDLNLQPEDYKFLSSIKLSILRGIIGEVIPSLRSIYIAWKPGDKVVKIFFYHSGAITEAIQSHYSAIMAVVGGDSWEYMGKVIDCDFDIIRLDYPQEIPQSGYIAIVYERKEPFKDPTDDDVEKAHREYLASKAKKQQPL